MRLFAAINFTPEFKDGLKKAISELRRQTVSANFTREENLHMTLAFIGESERTRDIKSAIDETFSAPLDMTLSLGRAGHFGSLYYAGVKSFNAEGEDKLGCYAEALAERLRERDFDIERREFKPHITLAREVNAIGQIKLSIPRAEMQVHRISLMRSDRIQTEYGSRMKYTEIWGKDV